MNVAITGASGLIGSAVSAALRSAGNRVVPLVREERAINGNSIFWDPNYGVLNAKDLDGFDTIIHLSGKNIASGYWTEKFKRELFESRVQSTELLVKAISQMKNPPRTLICASAVGIYGERADEFCYETDLVGDGFLASLCETWEQVSKVATAFGVRVINARFGMVLSKDGGALKQMLWPFRLGFGGKFGSGKQYLSWIALEDAVSAIIHCLTTESIAGPVNFVTAEPVTNEQFTKSLGHQLHRPTFCAIPEFILKATLGELAKELLLTSIRAYPQALEDSGYSFGQPTLAQALNLLR